MVGGQVNSLWRGSCVVYEYRGAPKMRVGLGGS